MTGQSKKVLIVGMLAMLSAALVTISIRTLFGLDSEKNALSHKEAALRYPYQQLNAKEKALYGALYEGIAQYEKTIELPDTYDKETYERVFLMVAEQEPQFFYLDSVYETAELMDKVNMHYKLTEDQIGKMSSAMQGRADTIIRKLPENADDFDKLLKIHDEIADYCEYTDGTYQDEAYGCLAEGAAKCEGYAKAFLYTARRAGFNVMNVTGTINGKENHVWNIAEVNGKYYHIDVTWDDSTQFKGHTTHTCFAVADAMFRDHIPDLTAYQPPCCEDDTKNYYARKALIVNHSTELPQMISTWLDDPMLMEFRLADNTVEKAVKEIISTSKEIREAVRLTSGAMNYRAYMDDSRNVLVIMPS